MGGREVGGLANLLSAHRDLANPEHRAEVARLWGVPSVPERPGKTAIELFAALKRGEIKAVWIACTNPAQSLPDQTQVRAALQAADFVVLQEAYANTDTAAYADLMLPATTWGEKEGTVTNSERCITHITPAVAARARRVMTGRSPSTSHAASAPDCAQPLPEELFPYASPERSSTSIARARAAATSTSPASATRCSTALGPQQWPFPEGASSGRQRLYEDGVFPTANGRARFVVVEHRPTAEAPTPAHPISLLSGRLRDQWHGMSRTGTVARLFNLDDEPLLDAPGRPAPARPGRRRSGAGAAMRAAASSSASPRRRPAARRAWLPMHWGSQFMNSAGVNALTLSARDPFSQQPELKHAAVAVDKADLPWQLVILRKAGAGELARARPARQGPHACSATSPSPASGSTVARSLGRLPRRARQRCRKAACSEIDALFGLDADDARRSSMPTTGDRSASAPSPRTAS
jgi:assimilatory nitrate reductase catalytic subunit